MEKNHQEARELFDAILALKTTEECEAFFEDLCTIKEIQDLSQRFQVAKMLSDKRTIKIFPKPQAPAPPPFRA